MTIIPLDSAVTQAVQRATQITVPSLDRLDNLVIDETYIRRSLDPDDTISEAMVREHHEAIFDKKAAGLIDEADGCIRQAKVEEADIDAVLDRVITVKARTKRFIEDARQDEVMPWNGFSIAQFVILGFIAVVLLGMGVSTIYSYIIGSGLPPFVENPALAWLFSLIPLGISGALKALEHFLVTDEGRRRYGLAVWCLGITAGFSWIILFAYAFPNSSTSSADAIIDAVSRGDGAGEPANVRVWLAMVQLFAEAFISAGCFLTMRHIYDEHRIITPKRNPRWIELDKDETDLKCARELCNQKIAPATAAIGHAQSRRDEFLDEADGFRRKLLIIREANMVPSYTSLPPNVSPIRA